MTYFPSVWLNVHDYTSLLVQRHCTVLGKRRTNRSAIGCELVSPSNKRMVPIGRVSLARESEAGAVGGRKSIFSMLTYRTLFLFLLVIIELFPNSLFQLCCPKDYKQKQ